MVGMPVLEGIVQLVWSQAKIWIVCVCSTCAKFVLFLFASSQLRWFRAVRHVGRFWLISCGCYGSIHVLAMDLSHLESCVQDLLKCIEQKLNVEGRQIERRGGTYAEYRYHTVAMFARPPSSRKS